MIQLTKSAARSDESTNAKLLKNTINNENNDQLGDLAQEYDRRLDEQVTLAKLDMINELEIQIKVSKRIPRQFCLIRCTFVAVGWRRILSSGRCVHCESFCD